MKAVAVFSISLAFFWNLAAKDLTWANGIHDMADELWAARAFGLQHPTGSPLYIALGWLATRGVSDWGNVAHRLSTVLSALPAAITATILYITTRRLLAPLLFCGSIIIVSQSGIPKYYALASLIVLLQWLTRRTPWFWVISLLGVTLHHLPGFALLIITVWRWRHGLSWWPIAVVIPLAAGVYWTYWRFAIRPPSALEWRDWSFARYMGGQGFLLFGLSPYPLGPLLARLRDIALLLPGAVGVGLFGLLWVKDRWLLAMVGIFAFYYATDLDPHVYTYLVVPVTLAIYAACQADTPLRFRQVAALVAVGMVGWNITHMDLGVNLDPAPTAARTMYAQFANLPTGAVLDVGDLGTSTLMPLLFDGRWSASFASRSQVTHCEADINYTTMRAIVLPVSDPRCSE